MRMWPTGAVPVLLLLLFHGCAPGSVDEPDTLVLVGATVIDGSGAPPRANARVVVTGGRIACIGDAEACPTPEGAREVDLTGQWILPGLVDAHVHFSQTGWFDGRPDTLDLTDAFPYSETQNTQKRDPQRYYDSYLCSGVTAVYDVGGFPWSWDLRGAAERNPRAPHVAAAGPLVTHAAREALNLPGESLMINLSGEEVGRNAVRYLADMGSDAVKVWFLRVSEGEQEAIDARVLAVGEEARERDIPLIVHATSLREAKVALRAGARLLVHGVEDVVVDEEFLSLARENSVIYTPTLIVSDGYRQMFEAAKGLTPPELDDPNRCIDPDTRAKILSAAEFRDHPSVSGIQRDLVAYRDRLGASYERKVENLRRVHAAGIAIAVGTDAGNPGTFHGPSYYAEIEAMQEAGIEASELLVMATRNGAAAMGRDDIGTLQTGNLAGLIVVEADPTQAVGNLRKLTHVMLAGRLYTLAELKRRSE